MLIVLTVFHKPFWWVKFHSIFCTFLQRSQRPVPYRVKDGKDFCKAASENLSSCRATRGAAISIGETPQVMFKAVHAHFLTRVKTPFPSHLVPSFQTILLAKTFKGTQSAGAHAH